MQNNFRKSPNLYLQLNMSLNVLGGIERDLIATRALGRGSDLVTKPISPQTNA